MPVRKERRKISKVFLIAVPLSIVKLITNITIIPLSLDFVKRLHRCNNKKGLPEQSFYVHFQPSISSLRMNPTSKEFILPSPSTSQVLRGISSPRTTFMQYTRSEIPRLPSLLTSPVTGSGTVVVVGGSVEVTVVVVEEVAEVVVADVVVVVGSGLFVVVDVDVVSDVVVVEVVVDVVVVVIEVVVVVVETMVCPGT